MLVSGSVCPDANLLASPAPNSDNVQIEFDDARLFVAGGRMGEWSPSLASRDFLSLYTSMSKRSPVNRVGAAEIFRGFSPPANGHAGPDDEDGLFCNRRNVDECISYLNKVQSEDFFLEFGSKKLESVLFGGIG